MQLLHGQLDHSRIIARPDETFAFQPLVQEPEAIAAPAQQLDAVASAVGKDVDGAGKRIESEIMLHQRGQSVNALAKVDHIAMHVYRQVRIQAKYRRSLEVLKTLKQSGMRTKTGIMLGLGETREEILESMNDLLNAGVHILTLGQYLQPTKEHLPVAEFIRPDVFAEYKTTGLQMGFRYVESGPLVRSSYHAEKHLFNF